MSDVKIENLKVAYGDNVIFDDFSIDFAEHKILSFSSFFS
jgi:ABC-type sugar transport system ATPase subunit